MITTEEKQMKGINLMNDESVHIDDIDWQTMSEIDLIEFLTDDLFDEFCETDNSALSEVELQCEQLLEFVDLHLESLESTDVLTEDFIDMSQYVDAALNWMSRGKSRQEVLA